MKKYFVLDTNVLLHDPNALFAFGDNQVVLPLVVIEELDTFKKRQDEVGRNSRVASHNLDNLRKTTPLCQGVALENGGTLTIEMANQDTANLVLGGLKENSSDNQILAVAAHLKKNNQETQVTVVSKDLNMRIKADALGLHTEDYESDTVDIEELYSGYRELTVPGAQVDAFFQNMELPVPAETRLYKNEFVMLIDDANQSHTALAQCRATSPDELTPLHYMDKKVWGIKARNKEQRFALEVLMDDEVQLVSLVGFAGTGKTLLALASGLQKVVDENKYKKLLVSRPIIPMGKDIGYLPGDVEEKLLPRMQPISDNLEFLFSQVNERYLGDSELHELIENGVVELEPLTYIRGRSIPGQFIIVDEAQNLTPHEIKTIITRAGANTKIVLTGDPYQIDHPYLDSRSNGLTYLVERFKDQAVAGHVMFSKGERSDLAELAAQLLR